MEFRDITIKDKEIITGYLNKEDRISCMYCFTDIFMWKDKYNVRQR